MASAATRRAKAAGTLAEKVQRHLREQARGKRHYERADALLDEIEREMTRNEKVKLDNGQFAYLRDKLDGGSKTRHFHGSYFRRFEIEVKNT